MDRPLRHISRIRENFDTVICGVNGVLTDGRNFFRENIETLIKLYQSGVNIALASNSGLRARDMFMLLRRGGVPMNIFYALITAGEIAHFYLKNKDGVGKSYFPLAENISGIMSGLAFSRAQTPVLSDFILAETTNEGLNAAENMPILEQALNLRLPLLCVGNDTQILTPEGVKDSVGCLAEQYAMLGGKIISFGKPDLHIVSYLTEQLADFQPERCLCIGDSMATDMRMGNHAGMRNLLLTGGVHQLVEKDMRQVEELCVGYGLNVDYCMEKLVW